MFFCMFFPIFVVSNLGGEGTRIIMVSDQPSACGGRRGAHDPSHLLMLVLYLFMCFFVGLSCSRANSGTNYTISGFELFKAHRFAPKSPKGSHNVLLEPHQSSIHLRQDPSVTT